MHISREKLGMACAIAAVACLSSVMVRWSDDSRQRESVREHPLFGDFAEEDRLPEQFTPLDSVFETGSGPIHEPAQEPGRFPQVEGREIGSATGAIPTSGSHVTFAGFTESDAVPAHPLSVAAQQIRAGEEAVWLSGEIEEGVMIEEGVTEEAEHQPSSVRIVPLGATTSDD